MILQYQKIRIIYICDKNHLRIEQPTQGLHGSRSSPVHAKDANVLPRLHGRPVAIAEPEDLFWNQGLWNASCSKTLSSFLISQVS
jgi:hypothetical protein